MSNSTEENETQSAPTSRNARCSYFGGTTFRMKKYACCGCERCRIAMAGSDIGRCQCVVPSRPDLAFFKSKPEVAEDEFYCGCMGWE